LDNFSLSGLGNVVRQTPSDGTQYPRGTQLANAPFR